MSSRTIFDQIVDGSMKSWVIWEDADHLAFLTPFPNTPGVSVVIPKVNPGNDAVELDDKIYTSLLLAVKKVAKLLKNQLQVPRVAIVFEGTGVAHVHAKLYPLHGSLAAESNLFSKHTEFYPEYIGYITTVEGRLQSEKELNDIQQKITHGQKK